MKSIVSTLIIGATLATMGCTNSAPRRPDPAWRSDYLAYAGPPVDRFHSYRLYNWEVVGPNQLVLWSTPWQAYLVTVWSPCTELAFANRLGLTSTFGTVSTLDSIVLRNHTRCPIEQIRPIDLKRLNADRAARREAQS